MKKIGWFEIPVTDLERAKKFYEGVTGETLESMEMGEWKMAMFPGDESEGQPHVGGLMQGEGYTPSMDGAILYFTCPDIDEGIKRVTDNGGEVLLPKKDLGKKGFVAWFKDTEGNRQALHQVKQ